jgi:hypothetical protein
VILRLRCGKVRRACGTPESDNAGQVLTSCPTDRQSDVTPILRLISTGFTDMVNCGDTLPSTEPRMTRGAKRKEKPTPTEGATVRATISFPSEIYQTLEDIARQKKVSLAWVVREASEQYIADKWPLLAPRKGA